MSQKKTFKATLSSCTFTNISVDNFRTIYSPFPVGSCILCKESGDLELSDCTFTNCRAAYDGGAIYAESQAININYCHFISCHASSEQDDQSRGGTIYLDARNSISSEILVKNIFENCTSTHSGGALFVYCKDVYETESIKDYGEYAFRLSDCNFTFCKSGKEGGAISSGEPRTDGQEGALGDNDFLLSICYFTECESGNGGALFFQDGTKEGNEETFIMRCYFINCFASGGEGYAISSRSYILSITACSFTEHKRGNVGSSHCIVYIEMNEAQISPTFLSNTFEDNNINAFNIIVNDQVLINNLNINNYNNDQYTDTPCINLDLWSTTGIFTLINCHFTNISNMRCISSLQSRVIANISQCTFTNIKSTLPTSDGSLLQYGSCISSISNWNNIFIYGNTFTNVEVVNGHGGAIYAFVQSIEIEDCIFTKCTVSSQTSSSFPNAMAQGGAIYLDASNERDEELIKSCTFTNCSSTYNGGAIFVFCSDQNDTTSNKNLYSARNEGSYIQCKESGDLELSDCTFTNCRAAYDGGAIYAESQAININDCHFISCYASSEQDGQSRGGAIYLDARNSITYEQLRNNIFENCTSTHSGGALFFYCKDSNMIMVENSTFENNKSYRHGGAIATEKSNNIFIAKCIFENNEANYHPDFSTKSPYEIGNGGSIYIYTSYCTDFLQCQESNPINKSIIQIEDCLFKNNYGFNGHAIYIFGEKYGPIINITNNEFINNLNEYSVGNKTFLILSELCPIYINQITKENTFLIEHQNVDILSTNCIIEPSQTLSFLKSSEFSNSRTFSSTDIFTSTESLSFQDSNFSEKVGDFIVSKSFSLTYVIRRSVSYSFSYFLSHSFYMSYNENLGMSTVVLTQSLANGYFPYIIYFYSPIYVEQEIKIQIMKKRISPEQLIGIVCGSISVFFLILGIIINNIRRSNELKNKNNEYDYILFFDDEIKEVQNNEQNEIGEIENNDQTDIIEDSSYDFLEFWA